MRAAGTKAFCAGGDIKWIVDEAGARQPGEASNSRPLAGIDGVADVDVGGGGVGMLSDRFFRREYLLLYTTSKLPVPYIALIDGYLIGAVCYSHRTVHIYIFLTNGDIFFSL